MSDQTTPAASAAPQSFPCTSCGARVEFAPGTNTLQCPYCGHQQNIQATGARIQEHSFAQLAHKPRRSAQQMAAYRLVCQQCGAHTESSALSQKCQFCAAPLVADTSEDHQIAPEAVLPFALDRSAARDALRTWVKSRWFAPNRLKKVTEAESTKSTYVPHWTYDSHTTSQYQGERGDYYYVTETYTVTVNGNTETRTRQVRKIRWSPAAGRVSRFFDDVLVIGSRHVTHEQLSELEPWPLNHAQPYQPTYLAGHHTLRYDVEPEAGFEVAKQKMAKVIDGDCRRDIGGDQQRVHQVNTAHAKTTYKLMLLPVWICCYLFAGKNWQVLINGQTGEVQGARPYSVAKIATAVTAGLLVVALIIFLFVINGNP
ncbi:hypothetical protein FB566_0461 [Stackebrandtia endophytica]|uniref:Uncharacterized protein n=1 Tax=Stackebrandtia endophytica TaxID=1496996 RepID=A0A543AQW7_9ACTN|nr:hypothetical protein [Stackebrandtia endophytica]TQL74970.1 hypothetical protein FB566_0461 [Stackebrandtia endophytica]